MKSLNFMIIAALYACNSYGFTLPISAINDSLIVNTSLTDETCNLDNGTISITVVGDSTGVTYSIDSGITYTSNPNFTGLTAGDYLIIAQRGACFAVQSAQIEDLDGPELAVFAECVPGQNKIMLSSEVNASIAVTFRWEGPNNISHTDSIVSSTIPGTYAVTITDNLGCTSESSVTLESCCALNLDCDLQPIVETCMSVAPDSNPALLDPMASKEEIIDALRIEGIAVDTGSCGTLKVEINDTPLFPADCNEEIVIERIYTISDSETSFDCSQTISISDHTSIELLGAAQDQEISCEDDFMSNLQNWIDDNGGMILNGCSGPYEFTTDLNSVLVQNGTGSCGDALEITFTATDACGNSVNSIASFIVSDDEDPIISCPEPINISAVNPQLEQDLDAWLESVQITDNCSDNPATNNLDLSLISTDCDDADQLEIIFTTEDDCGNTATCIGLVNIFSPFVPTLNCGEDIEIDCSEDKIQTAELWIADFTAENPDGTTLLVTNSLDLIELSELSCGESLDVTFSVLDDCDRELTCLKTIFTTDNQAPEITCPDVLTLSASDLDATESVTLWLMEIVAEDNCSSDLMPLNDLTQDFSDLCSISDDIPVVFSVTDDCGNENDCASSISVLHNQPSIDCPQELTINCGDADEAVLTSDWIIQATATENDGNDITNTLADLAIISCESAQIVEFKTVDNCGTEVSCTSTIKVIDEESPIITCPAEITLDIETSNLDADIEQWLASAIATDCNSVDVNNNFDNSILSEFACTEPYDISFEATDACGLTSVCQAILTIENNRDLSIICPDRIEVQCTDPQLAFKVEEFIKTVIVETQNEYDLTENISQDISSLSCMDSESVEIEVIAKDQCDNEASCFTGVDFLADPQIYIPNVFTPNGDNFNDYFTAYGNETVDYIVSMVIYNRWGSKIYESENLDINEDNQGWDGRYAGEKEKTEVFTYLIKIMDVFGNEIEKVGTIQIISD